MDANDTLAAVQQLAARIDKLLDLTRRLADENRSLRQGQEQLANERAQLLNKNELARSPGSTPTVNSRSRMRTLTGSLTRCSPAT